MSLVTHLDKDSLLGRVLTLCANDEPLYRACATSFFRVLSKRTHNHHDDYLRGVGMPANDKVQADPMADPDFLDCQSALTGLAVPIAALQEYPAIPDLGYFNARVRGRILVATGLVVQGLIDGASAPAGGGGGGGGAGLSGTRSAAFGTPADLAAGRWGDEDIAQLVTSAAWNDAQKYVAAKNADDLHTHVHVALDATTAGAGVFRVQLLTAYLFDHRAYDDSKDKVTYSLFLEGINAIKKLLRELGSATYVKTLHYALENKHKDSAVELFSAPTRTWLPKNFYCFATTLGVRAASANIKIVKRKGLDVQEYAFNYHMSIRQFGDATDAMFKCLAQPQCCTLTADVCSRYFGDILTAFETPEVMARPGMDTAAARVQFLMDSFLVPAMCECERRRTLLTEFILDSTTGTVAPTGSDDGFFKLEFFLNPVTGKDLIPGLWGNMQLAGFRHATLPFMPMGMTMPASVTNTRYAASMASPAGAVGYPAAFMAANPALVINNTGTASTGSVTFGSTTGIPPAAAALDLQGLGLTPAQAQSVQSRFVSASPAPQGGLEPRALRPPHYVDGADYIDDGNSLKPAASGYNTKSRGQRQREERKSAAKGRGRDPSRHHSPPPRRQRRRSKTPPGSRSHMGIDTPRGAKHATRSDYNRSYLEFATGILSKGQKFVGVECPDEAQLKLDTCACAECADTWGFLHGSKAVKKSRLSFKELQQHNTRFCAGGVLMPGHFQKRATREKVWPH